MAVSTIVNASSDTTLLENAWSKENNLRTQNETWIGADRNANRKNIQSKILLLIKENKLTDKDIKQAYENSEITTKALIYVDSNKDLIIKQSGCSNEIACNEVLYKAYVQKSDSI